MKHKINGHLVTIDEVSDKLSYIILTPRPAPLFLTQRLNRDGELTIKGTAWTEQERDLVKEVFPNLTCTRTRSAGGSTVWEFKSN